MTARGSKQLDTVSILEYVMSTACLLPLWSSQSFPSSVNDVGGDEERKRMGNTLECSLGGDSAPGGVHQRSGGREHRWG